MRLAAPPRPVARCAGAVDDANWGIVVVASVALVATSPGQTYIVSLFNESLRQAIGLSLTELSAAYLAATLSSASMMVWLGRFSDRFGPRLGMGIAATGLGLACVWMSAVHSFVALIVGFFSLRFLGQAALSLYSGHTLALWFERRLGTVEGFRCAAFGIAVATLPAFVVWSITAHGWRTTYLGLGAAVWLTVLPCVLFLHRGQPATPAPPAEGEPSEDVEDVPAAGRQTPASAPNSAPISESNSPAATAPFTLVFTLSDARGTLAYWQLALSTTAMTLISTALIFHMQPLLALSGVALGSASLLAVFAVTSTFIPLTCGWIADRIAPAPLVCTAMSALALACVMFAAATTPLLLYAAMAILGFGVGTNMITISPNVARFFGKPHHGAIRASLSSLAVAGTAVGPLALGVCLEWSGERWLGLGLMAGAAFALAIWGLWLRRPSSVSSRK